MAIPDRLYLMELFVEIVHLGTFKAAAQKLGVTQSKATKDIQRLETSLGSNLLNRTTRSVGITRAGEIYYGAAMKILEDYNELAESLDFVRNRLSGELRVTAPMLWGDAVLTPLILEFQKRNTDVSIIANYSDHFVDLFRENIHIAFRTTVPENEPYLSKKICEDTTVICASRKYFETREIPEKPADLEDHDFITFGQDINRYTRLVLKRESATETVTVGGRLSFSSMRSVFNGTLGHHGIASVPRYLAQPEIDAGNLVAVLPEYELQKVWFHAFYTERKRENSLVAAFIDFVQDQSRRQV